MISIRPKRGTTSASQLFLSRLGLALLMTGNLVFTACTQAEITDLLNSSGSAIANQPEVAEFAPGAHQYGADGVLSLQDVETLKSLAWPQTYDAMKGTFGFPAHRTTGADYYQIDGIGNQWAVVFYDGKTATNYRFEEK